MSKTTNTRTGEFPILAAAALTGLENRLVKIVNVSDVMQQDLGFFRKFFWGCLDKGVYLAPSPYETGFISLAHTEADLDDTLTVFDEVLAAI